MRVPTVRALAQNLARSYESYDVPKLVRLRSKRLALSYNFASLAVLIYVGIYSFYFEKSYQAVSDFVAASEVRLSGFVSDALNRSYSPEDFSSVEGHAFFIATAVQQTPQLQGVCAGRRNLTWDAASANGGEACLTAADCANGRRSVSGVQTGACDASGFCLLRTWCPLEAQPQRTQAAGAPAGHGNSAASNATTVVSFTGVEDIQVSLFISVQWVKFLSADGKTESWDSPTGRGTSGGIFYTIGDLLARAGTTYADVAASGADVTLNFRFDCDWDLAQAKKACKPELLAARIDPRGYNRALALPTAFAGAAPGYSARTLQRTTGVYFRLQYSGQARQFDFDSTITTIGSLLYFLSLLGVVLDWMAPYLLPLNQRDAVAEATVDVVMLPPPQYAQETELKRRGGGLVAVAAEGDGHDAAPANGKV